MRQIKFRAKVKGDAGMWGVTVIDWLNQRVMLDGARANWHPIKKIQDLMQFTGLHDKNGKEIYEGDIVEDRGECFLIKWSENLAMFGLFNEEGFQESLPPQSLLKPDYMMKTIGNVYSNPELLK